MIRAIARVAVANPVAANLAMGAVLVCGLIVYGTMPREVFPDISLGQIEVRTTYPGASPEDVERLVTLPLEGAVEGVDGIDEMTSTSREGISRITLTLRDGEDTSDVLEDVRDAVRREAPRMPGEAEEPVVEELETVFPVVAVFVYGVATEGELRRLAELHERGIEALDGVREAFVTGLREPRLWIEVEPLALERYGLSLEDVGRAVESRARDAPLGSLATEQGDWLVRVDAQLTWADDLADLPVIAKPDGEVVRLSQVASPSDTFERDLTRARFNGQPCIHLQVNKTATGDMITIAEAVQEYVRVEGARMPAGTALGTNADLSVYVRNRLQVMKESGTLGAILLLGALLLFLNVRVALVTALGIPVAFLGGILIAGSLGVTMNMLTMFALIVVLGMLVDDAIVVGENIYRLIEEGYTPAEAAIEGTGQVGRPVIATILTSVAAFLPILMLEGQTGLLMRPLPLVVSFCLGVSILEALVILPAHFAHWIPAQKRAPELAEGATPARWYDPMRRGYVRLLELCLRWRYVTIAGAISLAAVLGGVGKHWIPFVFFDDFESKLFYVSLRLQPGTSLDETERVALMVEELALALPDTELESVNTLLGVSASDIASYEIAQNLAQVWVELREGESRQWTSAEVVERLREGLAQLPPIVDGFQIDQPQSGPVGRAIEISVRGPELATLATISEALQADLRTFAGIRDVHDTLEEGKREVRVVLNDRGRTLGFHEAGLAGELRAAFEGRTWARLRRGTDDVELVVKYPEALRESRGALEDLRVSLPVVPGAMLLDPSARTPRVPLGSVAELVDDVGPAVISHDGHARSVTVLADVNKAEGNAARIVEQLSGRWSDLAQRYPGYTLAFQGDIEDTNEAIAGLVAAGVVSLALIYLILGTLFRSFAQPFVIMFIIPFGAMGMILGHWCMDRSITLLSLIGLLALTGIVVNDSLILVDFVNERRARGEPLLRALTEAGRVRFRPILLTSVTTMLGLTPLTFFASGDARFLQPMAISLFFGLAFATFLVLLLVPCAYAVLADTLAWLTRPRQTFARLRARDPLHA